MEENEKQKSTGKSRPRQKKKSTLAKLKERKEREFGSTASLRSENIDEYGSRLSLNHNNDAPTATKVTKDQLLNNTQPNENGLSKPDFYQFSTKDPRTSPRDNAVSKSTSSSKPRPKPRGSTQRLSSSSGEQIDSDLHLDVNHSDKDADKKRKSGEKTDLSNSNSALRRNNYKQKSEQSGSVDSAASGGFTPKPPVTPRSSKNTPRTPRGYVPAKRNQENHFLSGDESDVGTDKVGTNKGKKDTVEEKWMKDKSVFDISDLIVDEVELNPFQRKERNTTNASIRTEDNLSKSKPKETTPKLLSRRNSLGSKKSNDQTSNILSSNVNTDSSSIQTLGKANPPYGNKTSDCSPVLSASSLRGDDSPAKPSTAPLLKSRRRSGSCSPARALPDKFKHLASPSASSSHVSMDSHHHATSLGSNSNGNNPDSHNPQSYRIKSASFSTSTAAAGSSSSSSTASPPHHVHGLPVSTQVLYTSNENSRSVSTPPSSARLEPVSPRSQPPPLPKDFTSRSLRTSYKIDPNVRPHTSSGTGTRTGTPATRADGDRSDSGTASGADKVSQRSFSSGSILPIITTKEARSRSYLEGSISSANPSMLGSEELERYFPDRKVNVLVGTWNMNELKDVSTPLDDFILPERCDYVQDIYAIGTQENNMNKKEWEIKLQETLGPSHVMFHSVSLGALHLIIFVRRDLIWFCSLPEDDAISLRAVTMVKTKGAIGISFTMFGSYFLFINCHLTSDRDNDNTRKKHRMGDYHKVIQDMDFKLVQETKQAKSSSGGSSKKRAVDITSLYDCVFWCGDLNFRIERQRHAVEGKVNQITSQEVPNFEALLGGDQLLKYMMEGKIFNGFQEGRINFHPTFKFDVSKDTYDTSTKNRVPSYTDRIMFRSKKNNDISCLHYDAVMELKVSDHRPVFGQYEAGIKPGRDNMVFGAGHFDRAVYMEANQRRAANQSSGQGKKSSRSSSSICSLQ